MSKGVAKRVNTEKYNNTGNHFNTGPTISSRHSNKPEAVAVLALLSVVYIALRGRLGSI